MYSKFGLILFIISVINIKDSSGWELIVLYSSEMIGLLLFTLFPLIDEDRKSEYSFCPTCGTAWRKDVVCKVCGTHRK